MEPRTTAEELPALYRAVLDRVAELAAGGRREVANQIRVEATRIYSRAWDDRAHRDLEALLRRHSDSSVGEPTPGRGFRRRSVRAV